MSHRIRSRLLLESFIVRGPHKDCLRVLLTVLDQSNWEDQEWLHIYVPLDWNGDAISLRRKVSVGVSEGLTHRRWRLYMRKKHGGAEEAICDVALPLLCHGVLIPAYNRFCLKCRPITGRNHLGTELNVVAARGDPVLPMQLGDPESHQVPFEFDRAAWAAQNDRFRAKAHEFLNKSGVTPRDEVCALRMCIMPVQEMEKREFWVGSNKYELQQQGVAAAANLHDGQLNGSNLPDEKLRRDFQALVHARGEIEDKGMRKMRMLMFEPKLWSIFSDDGYRNDLKVKCAQSIAQSEALTQKLLAIPHRLTPHLLYLSLEQPDLIPQIKTIKECMLDAWSRDFLKNNDIASERGRMKLLVHMMMNKDNTDLQEVWNAQMRRHVKKRTQTQALDASQLSEKFMAMQFRYNDIGNVEDGRDLHDKKAKMGGGSCTADDDADDVRGPGGACFII